jgi:hypothetical protein
MGPNRNPLPAQADWGLRYRIYQTLCYGKCWSKLLLTKQTFVLFFFSILWHKVWVLIYKMFIFEKVGHSKFVEMHGNTSDFFQSARIAVFRECVKERTLYKLRLRFYLLVLCVYTFLLIWITKQRNGLLTTLLIVILLKRLFYNTRFILFSNGCKYVFMPLTELTQHGNDELLTTTYILS